MSSTSNSELQTVTASIKYTIPPADGVRPYQNIYAEPITGERKTNLVRVDHDAVIENLRGKEDSVSLDTAGFQFGRSETRHKSFDKDEDIEKEYYPESVELIKKLTGATRVVIFDHTIRRRDPNTTETGPSNRQPAAQAHVDQSFKAAVARVHRHVPEDAEQLLTKRFQIVNLWRPISHAAYDWPLALCDYRSVVEEEDTFPVALIYPHQEGETLGVKHSPNLRWKYLRGMSPDEFVLIKCAESIRDGSVSLFTPHTAFNDPSTPEGSPLRESIELRTLVFYD